MLERDSLVNGDDVISALLLLGSNFGRALDRDVPRSAIADGTPLFDFLGDPVVRFRPHYSGVGWRSVGSPFSPAFVEFFAFTANSGRPCPRCGRLAPMSILSMCENWLPLGKHLDNAGPMLRVSPLPTAGTTASTNGWVYAQSRHCHHPAAMNSDWLSIGSPTSPFLHGEHIDCRREHGT